MNRESMHQQELTQMQEKLDAAEKDVSMLKKMLSAAADVIRDICKAIGMLTDYRGGKFLSEQLSDEQESLIDAVREIGSAFLKKISFRKYAQDVEENVGISSPVQEKIAENIERRYYSRGGMSR